MRGVLLALAVLSAAGLADADPTRTERRPYAGVTLGSHFSDACHPADGPATPAEGACFAIMPGETLAYVDAAPTAGPPPSSYRLALCDDGPEIGDGSCFWLGSHPGAGFVQLHPGFDYLVVFVSFSSVGVGADLTTGEVWETASTSVPVAGDLVVTFHTDWPEA